MSVEILKRITNFSTHKELEQHLVSELLLDISKPGLVLLPVGATYEERIYPKLNQLLDGESERINMSLYVSHLDELIEAPKLFSETLKENLANLIDPIKDRFYAIDVENPAEFERFIHQRGGARAIYLGLGADPSTAHVAFIGEEYINREISIVELGESSATKLGVEKALTIGTDVFNSSSLEKIVITISGAQKSEAFKAALENPDTGLGFLIKNHLEKLNIFCDHLFIQGIRKLGVDF